MIFMEVKFTWRVVPLGHWGFKSGPEAGSSRGSCGVHEIRSKANSCRRVRHHRSHIDEFSNSSIRSVVVVIIDYLRLICESVGCRDLFEITVDKTNNLTFIRLRIILFCRVLCWSMIEVVFFK